jgi:hypothetical protein
VSEPSLVGELENDTEERPSKCQEDSLKPLERLQIQVCQVGGQAGSYDLPKQPIAWIGRAPVTISKLTLSMVLKSSIDTSSAASSDPYLIPEA